MAGQSSIEWTDRTWNPVVGCAIVSPGCTNCYAMKMAARIEAMGTVPHYVGLTRKVNGKAVWSGVMRAAPDHVLTEPLRWKRPQRIFVNSMSDLFGEGVADETIDRVFAVMAIKGHHTYQILTKRADRMKAAIERIGRSIDILEGPARALGYTLKYEGMGTIPWPLPNVWLGVSAEDQPRADERLPLLMATPAARRIVSAEPLLGAIDFRWALSRNRAEIAAGFLRRGHFSPGLETLRPLDQIIVGGESGLGARPLWVPHVRDIVQQTLGTTTAVFVKQLGAVVHDRNDAGFDGCDRMSWPDMDPDDIEHDLTGFSDSYQGAPVRVHLRNRKGSDMDEWPADLRLRQMPLPSTSRTSNNG